MSGSAILREHAPEPEPPHQFRVGKVLKHVADGPFAGCLRPAKLLALPVLNDALERRGSPAEHVERIAIAQETQYGVDVLARVFDVTVRRDS